MPARTRDDGADDVAVVEATADETRERMRRRAANWYVLTIAFVGLVGIATATPRQFLVLAPGLALAAAVLRTGWDRSPPPGLLAASAVVGAVTVYLTAPSPAATVGAFGLAITAGVWATHRTGQRLVSSIIGFGAVVAVAVAAVERAGQDDWPQVAVVAVISGAMIFGVIETDDQRRALDLLARAKDAERRASVLQERNRFAADLHDIQGHTLHVIKLKAAVAAKVQRTDPDRTREELAEIQRLVAETIEQGRQLATSTHELSLEAELANAVGLFEASGTATTVERDGDVVASHAPLLAQVLREATTNVLRHAQATTVRIRLDAHAITVSNDGLDRDDGPLRGLASLRDRVRRAGGELTAGRDGDRFVVAATFAEGAP